MEDTKESNIVIYTPPGVYIPPKKSASAESVFLVTEEINNVRKNIALGFLRLGQLFRYVKENALYKVADHETLGSYAASFGFSYSSVRSWIHIYELYKLKLERADEELQEATWGQLQVINPVVESDPDEWIAKARELSRGDLINEVRASQGREEMVPKRPEEENPGSETWTKYIETAGCAVRDSNCAGGIEKAHFPRTKVRADKHWHCIGLCHWHHIEDLHRHGVNHFIVMHRNQIFNYFYRYIELHK